MFEMFEATTGICPHCLMQTVMMVKDHLIVCISYSIISIKEILNA